MKSFCTSFALCCCEGCPYPLLQQNWRSKNLQPRCLNKNTSSFLCKCAHLLLIHFHFSVDINVPNNVCIYHFSLTKAMLKRINHYLLTYLNPTSRCRYVDVSVDRRTLRRSESVSAECHIPRTVIICGRIVLSKICINNITY